jgi:hypothetical protein
MDRDFFATNNIGNPAGIVNIPYVDNWVKPGKKITGEKWFDRVERYFSLLAACVVGILPSRPESARSRMPPFPFLVSPGCNTIRMTNPSSHLNFENSYF